MALITPFRDEGAAEDLLEVAQRHFARAILALDSATTRLEAGEDVLPVEMRAAAKDMRSAMDALFNERKRVDTGRKTDAGIVLDYGLDFGAARDEIRCLLDRIRESGDPGNVP